MPPARHQRRWSAKSNSSTRAIGKMVSELKHRGLYQDTAIIITPSTANRDRSEPGFAHSGG